MSLRREQLDRYKRVNEENYFFIFRSSVYIFRKNKSLNRMSCDASGRVDNKERGKLFFMIKKKNKN